MAISLSKGQRIDLRKTGGEGLTRARFGLGWDAAKASKGFLGSIFGGGGPTEIDLDASLLMLDQNREFVDVVFFNQLQSKDGSIRHSGDNRTGDGEGDDETIFADLDRVPANVHHLVLTVNSYQGQTFDKVDNATCRIIDEKSGDVIATFNLSEKGTHTGVVMGVISRGPGGWSFKADGTQATGRTVRDMIPYAQRVA